MSRPVRRHDGSNDDDDVPRQQPSPPRDGRHIGGDNDNDDVDGDDDVIDLDDPHLAVLDDAQMRAMADDDDDDDDDDDNDDNDNSAAAAAGDFVYDDDGAEDEADGVDLNAAPDVEPARDDAVATFTPVGAQPLHALALHPHDATLLAAAGEADVVYVLQLTRTKRDDDDTTTTTLTLLHTLAGHDDTVSLLAFSPDGAWLASAGLDGAVALWRTSTWSCAHVLRDLSGEVLSLLWHPSSRVLVASADDAQTAMWSVDAGALLVYFAGQAAAVACVAWSPDYKRLLTGSGDGTVAVYSCKTAECERHVTRDLSADHAGITALCVPATTVTAAAASTAAHARSVNSDHCLVGCDDGTLHVLSLRTGKVVAHAAELHTQAIEVLRCNDAGTLLLSASCDCRVIVWNAADISARVVLDVGEGVVAALWLRDYTVVAGCSDGSVRAWDGRDVAQTPRRVWLGHRRLVLALATTSTSTSKNNSNNGTSDGSTAAAATLPPLLVSASDDGSVRVFDCAAVAV